MDVFLPHLLAAITAADCGRLLAAGGAICAGASVGFFRNRPPKIPVFWLPPACKEGMVVTGGTDRVRSYSSSIRNRPPTMPVFWCPLAWRGGTAVVERDPFIGAAPGRLPYPGQTRTSDQTAKIQGKDEA